MEAIIIETKFFSKSLEFFIKKRLVLRDDYELFKRELAAQPTQGDPIPGTGGVQKIRMRSANKGKRGGFRICYFYLLKDDCYLFVAHI